MATTVEQHDMTKCNSGESEKSTGRGGNDEGQESTEKDNETMEEVKDRGGKGGYMHTDR